MLPLSHTQLVLLLLLLRLLPTAVVIDVKKKMMWFILYFTICIRFYSVYISWTYYVVYSCISRAKKGLLFHTFNRKSRAGWQRQRRQQQLEKKYEKMESSCHVFSILFKRCVKWSLPSSRIHFYFFFVVVVGSTLSDVYAPRDPSHTQDEEGLCLYIFPGGSGQKGRPVCEQMNAHTQFAKWANTFFLWGFNSLGEDRKWLEQRRFRIGRPDSITVDSIFSSQFFLFHP